MCYSLWYNAPTMLPATGRQHRYISLYFLRHAKQSQFIPLQNVVYFITLYFLVRKIFTFYINDVLLFKCPFPGPKGENTFYEHDISESGSLQTLG